MMNSGQLPEFWTPGMLKDLGPARLERATNWLKGCCAVERKALTALITSSKSPSRIVRASALVSRGFVKIPQADSGRFFAARAATDDSTEVRT